MARRVPAGGCEGPPRAPAPQYGCPGRATTPWLCQRSSSNSNPSCTCICACNRCSSVVSRGGTGSRGPQDPRARPAPNARVWGQLAPATACRAPNRSPHGRPRCIWWAGDPGPAPAPSNLLSAAGRVRAGRGSAHPPVLRSETLERRAPRAAGRHRQGHQRPRTLAGSGAGTIFLCTPRGVANNDL